MTVQQQVMQLPTADKLRLMEALWTDLSRNEAEIESPEWHKQALKETESRLSQGKEEVIDWEDAKRQLRNEN